jgi:hypothetical protein
VGKRTLASPAFSLNIMPTLQPSVLVPPDYDTLLPPSQGGSFVDPAFGTSIQRISDAAHARNADGGGFLTWIMVEYSTMSPFNQDDSLALLVHQSYFALYDSAGRYIRDLPLEVNASSEPRWSRANNHEFYYVHGNQLKVFDATTGQARVVRTFGEYSSIYGMGESDISMDGDHLVFAGDRRYIFVYTISTDSCSPALDAAGRGFDSLYLTPYNQVLVSWGLDLATKLAPIDLYDPSMAFVRQIFRVNGHKDVALDTDGSEIVVITNSAEPAPNVGKNAVIKVRLSDAKQTCLQELDWSLAVHISTADHTNFCFVSTYAPGNPEPPAGWYPFTNEILQVFYDGTPTVRLAHHRSRPHGENQYDYEAWASANRSGNLLLFSSDFDLQAQDKTVADEYSDVYLIQPVRHVPIPGPQPPRPPHPAPEPHPRPGPVRRTL